MAGNKTMDMMQEHDIENHSHSEAAETEHSDESH